jgi:hypothetical protein
MLLEKGNEGCETVSETKIPSLLSAPIKVTTVA